MYHTRLGVVGQPVWGVRVGRRARVRRVVVLLRHHDRPRTPRHVTSRVIHSWLEIGVQLVVARNRCTVSGGSKDGR